MALPRGKGAVCHPSLLGVLCRTVQYFGLSQPKLAYTTLQLRTLFQRISFASNLLKGLKPFSELPRGIPSHYTVIRLKVSEDPSLSLAY